MLTKLYLLVNSITIILVVGYTYEFKNGTKIPYLTYGTYAQMDVTFANPMQYFKGM